MRWHSRREERATPKKGSGFLIRRIKATASIHGSVKAPSNPKAKPFAKYSGANSKTMVRILYGTSTFIMFFLLMFGVVFALVTVSGSLVVYSMHVTWKSIVKIAAHAGEATSLDWHPTRPYVIATGGSGDRCVKGKKSKAFNRCLYNDCSDPYE